jgi:hypothetical protein
LLRRLYQEEWTHRYFDNTKDVEAQRNVIGLQWGYVKFDGDYERTILEKQSEYIETKMFPVLKEYLAKTLERLNEDESGKKWIPLVVKKKKILDSKDKSFSEFNVLCRVCQVSHEAEEFFSSLLDLATSGFLNSEEYRIFLKQYGYMYDDEEQ